MVSAPSPSAIAGLTAFLLVFCCTVPTFWSLFDRARSKPKSCEFEVEHKLYEDQDGVATEESQKGYSATIPKYIALSSSVTGFLASVAIAAFASVHGETEHIGHWLVFATWVGDVLYTHCNLLY